MLSPKQEDLLDVFRRLGERGRRHAEIAAFSRTPIPLQTSWGHQVDLWQHLLDELERFTKEP